MQLKKELAKKSWAIKLSRKAKKLKISKELLDVLIERYDMSTVQKIFSLISKCDSPIRFRDSILELCQDNRDVYVGSWFLLGTVTGHYDFYSLSMIDCQDFQMENFKLQNPEETLNILRNHFYDYVLNNNELKNCFLLDGKGNYNYTLDLNRDFCNQILEEVITGNGKTGSSMIGKCYEIARNYLTSVIGIYGEETIRNHFDFITFDNMQPKKGSVEERKNDYLKEQNLSPAQRIQIQNLELLEKRVSNLSLEEAKDLLDKIRIAKQNPIEHLEELEEFYSQYEVLLRSDMVNHLWVPDEPICYVDSFQDTRPQLLHLFMRDAEKFRAYLEEQAKKEIINARIPAKTTEELTAEEQVEWEKRKAGIDAMINQAQVNYSFYDEEMMYSDKDGLTSYHSDTSNQISASIFSEQYFRVFENAWRMGIGFNREGLGEEAVALVSSRYLTTNRSLNNMEYDQNREFENLSASYPELVKNDGKSEVVLLRRGMDFDTKANYVFVTIDSREQQKGEEFIAKAKSLADSAHLKLVVYDVYKIHLSYEQYLREEKEAQMENTEYGKAK